MLIPKIAEAELVQDADVFNDITVFERSNMVIASRQKIAQRYIRTTKDAGVMWIVKEFCYNASNEIVMIHILSNEKNIPDWCAIYSEIDK